MFQVISSWSKTPDAFQVEFLSQVLYLRLIFQVSSIDVKREFQYFYASRVNNGIANFFILASLFHLRSFFNSSKIIWNTWI